MNLKAQKIPQNTESNFLGQKNIRPSINGVTCHFISCGLLLRSSKKFWLSTLDFLIELAHTFIIFWFVTWYFSVFNSTKCCIRWLCWYLFLLGDSVISSFSIDSRSKSTGAASSSLFIISSASEIFPFFPSTVIFFPLNETLIWNKKNH